MTIRSLAGAISRFRLILRGRLFRRSRFGLVREQGRNCGLEIVGPYRVPDVCWSVEVEGYGDVDYLLVGEEGEVGSFEGDGLRVVWKDWNGVKQGLETRHRVFWYLADKVDGKAGLDSRWPSVETVQFMYSRFKAR